MELSHHPSSPALGLSRTVVLSLALHAMVVAGLIVSEALSPRPMVLRDVIQVSLVPPAPEAPKALPAPPPPPPKEDPLWDKLASRSAPVPPPTKLADEFKALEDLSGKAPEAEPVPAVSDDLMEWWQKQKRVQVPESTPEDTAPVDVEAAALAEAWKRLAESPEDGAATPAESQELAQFWEQLESTSGGDARTKPKGGIPQYMASVERRISARWSPPDVFHDRDQMVVIITFPIMRDGAVGNVRVVDSSGSDLFDQTAVRSVLLSGPFPPFPEEMKEPRADIRVTFTLAGVSLI